MTLLGSMKAPDAKAVRSFASSAWAAFFVPRTVMKRVSRRPVTGSRPMSNFSRQLFFPRRLMLPFMVRLLADSAGDGVLHQDFKR